ncbi:hypothetical protein ACL0VS_03625 [Chryseobacterium sp. PMSZPI]|uniref:hypothetical protein n=1 Tax=Chryseobacterium sp. PMSZPI TaxID=1033900 RepID=UPI0039A1B3A7
MNKIILLTCLLSGIFYYAQNSSDNIQNQFIKLTASPTAKNFVKYGDHEPNLFTGTNVVNIPIYEVNTSNLKLPIYAEYASNGVKVNDESTWIGLSWNLRSGGIIVREVRDEADRLTFTSTNGTTPMPEDVYKVMETFPGLGLDFKQNLLLKNYLMKSVEPGYDTEPDIFSFDCPAGKGKFIITPQGKIIMEKQSDIDISLIEEGAVKGFILTDSKGIKYYFRDIEITGYAQPIGKPDAETAWYLSKIEHPLGDLIMFNYKNNILGTPSLGKESYNKSGTPLISSGNICTGETGNNIGIGYGQNIYGKIIEKITTNNQTIYFESTDNTSNPLKQIVTNIKITDNKSNKEIDNISLGYLTPANKRIFLKEIKSAKKNEKYEFDYYDPEKLPENLTSKAIDHWGYYNGNNGNTFLLPNNPNFPYANNGNRDVNSSFIKSGMLKTTIYPTKGKTEYLYSVNKITENRTEQKYKSASVWGQSGKNEYGIVKTSPPIQIKSSTLKILFSNNLGNECTGMTDPDIIQRATATLSIKDLSTGQYIGLPTNDPSNPTTNRVLIYSGNSYNKEALVNLNGTYEIKLELGACANSSVYISYEDGPAIQIPFLAESKGVRIEEIRNYPNSGNSYYEHKKYKYAAIDSDNESGLFGDQTPVNYEFKRVNENVKFVPTGNGFMAQWAICSIPSLESNNNKIYDTKYTNVYYPVVTELTKGKGATEYRFYDFNPSVYARLLNGFNTVDHQFDSRSDNGMWEFGNLKSIRNFKENTDKTFSLLKELEYKYTHQAQKSFSFKYFIAYKIFEPCAGDSGTGCYNGGYFEYLNIPTSLQDKKLYYYICHAQHKHQWDINSEGLQSCTAIGNQNEKVSMDYPTGIGGSILLKKDNFVEAALTSFQSMNYYLSDVEEKVYNSSGTIATTTKYFYSSPKHNELTSKNIIFPDGNISSVNYQYAHEKNNRLMVDKNMIGIPLETETKQTINGTIKILSKSESVYPKTINEIANNNAGLVLPLSVKSYDLQSPTVASTEVTYDRYDSKGNLQQYTTKDGVSTVIIWGYNQTQPIAKIENAKLSDINPSVINSIVGASDTDAAAGTNNDETNLLNAFKDFKNALPNYQITTYTYDPLIGVRSITPPSGIRESYLYDAANRLEKVVDANGNVLKEMKYNYKN